MISRDHSHRILDTLALARQIADYAQGLGIGISDMVGGYRIACNHLGAVLADCVLQAGLNYRTVVRARIERIIDLFPEAATLAGITELIERESISNFLLWKHSEKIERFIRLVRILEIHEIDDTHKLRVWLQGQECRDRLLSIAGIGPKTVDYLSCLVGNDCIAIDRHVKTFAKDAGVEVTDYNGLKLIFSYAADLLGMSRRDFDAWIWQFVSSKSNAPSVRTVPEVRNFRSWHFADITRLLQRVRFWGQSEY